MAGHSKWANIKHRKAAQDAKRGKVFTKLIREIVVAAKMGGGDIADNPRLRAVVDKALTANMTRDTINRAIARGAGDGDGENLDELTYEGYGTGGVAILVECLSDNRNRTVAEVRHCFTKMGGNLGTDGSVAYLFNKRGVIAFAPGADEDAVMEAALEGGAEDVETQDDGSIEVTCDPADFGNVQDALQAAGLNADNAEVTMIASTTVELDQAGAENIIKMVDMLEDLDDVQNVYSNADISEEVMEALSA